ncbi:unnamed protein product [Didymodactylos carnosus]|uniref:NADP-dependent glyceraldehyde-3-phosphate dehydrogenase n=1 Tax=Didymodactylos carnosus TaxID=1234261 RepID=A0A8S2GD00_9BILA|nr:unnamed protein product [Didymodactylos carnosus]CAF3496119.1 unnamed protein product [Didymodactylos carnosus]
MAVSEQWASDLIELKKLINQNSQKIVAVGEIAFLAQIQLASELNLPVVLHCLLAYDEMITLLKESGLNLSGIVHAFAGNQRQAQALLNLGFYLSVSGVITHPGHESLESVFAQVPLDHLVLETDAPYLKPNDEHSYTNLPGNVLPIAKQLANKLSIPTKEVIKHTRNNALLALKINQYLIKEVKANKKDSLLKTNLDGKSAALMLKHKDELASLLSIEIAKPYLEAEAEVVRTIEYIEDTVRDFEYLVNNPLTYSGQQLRAPKKHAIYQRVPLGVGLAISPFNYPINLAMSKLAPALVTGNTIAFKPATQGTRAALRMVELLYEGGVPTDVLVLIIGKGSIIGDYVVAHPAFAFINFTGGTEVGLNISKLAPNIPRILELGGNDPGLVLPDADLATTVKHIIKGAFSYSGQRCTAIKRVLVLKPQAAALIQMLSEEVKKLRFGPPDREHDLSAMISVKAADKAEQMLKEAIAGRYGLQASIFTTNLKQAQVIADQLEVGTVNVNAPSSRGPDILPYIGIKDSGQGVQGIREALMSVTRYKGTIINS